MKPAHVEDLYRLTPMQEGMLFHSIATPGSELYVEQAVATLRGKLEIEALERAWRRVVARHAALRSTFHWQELERPLQVVYREVDPPFEQLDWSGLPEIGLEDRFAALLEADRRRGFDLEEPPLLRFTLVRFEDRAWRLLWSYHHLLLDGWSLGLVLREVFASYAGERRGRPAALPPTRPYCDYIAWLDAQDRDAAERYWRSHLAGVGPQPLPEVHPRPRAASAQVDAEHTLPAATGGRLTAVARSAGATVGTLVQAAWAVLLARYSGEREVVFGTVVSGRPAHLAGVESMVGLFINTLPVRAVIEPGRGFLDWASALQRQLVEMRRHENSPLVEVRRWAGLSADVPLFETLVAFENYPRDPGLFESADDLEITDLESVERTNYPLNLSAVPGDELWMRLTFDRGRIDEAAARRLLGHVAVLLTAVANRPEQPLADLPLLAEPERREILAAGRGSAASGGEGLLHAPVEDSAARAPDAVALVTEAASGDRHLSYGALVARARELAARLVRQGVRHGDLVGICLERDETAVGAILAVLTAGAAWLPLDPHYPPRRIAAMLADARPRRVVTREEFRDRLPHDVPRLDLDAAARGPGSAQRPARAGSPEDLAYVFFTSGSSGRPKGVEILHRGAARAVAAARELLGIGPRARVLQAASLSFDASVLEIFSALSAGGRLCLATVETLLSGPRLVARLEALQIQTLIAFPSLLDALPEAPLPALRSLSVGGEAVRSETVARWAPGRRMLNLYAPTEASIFATAERLDAADLPASAAPALGKPIAGVEAWVLDRWGNVQPPGVPGELYLGGRGLARGYRGLPAQTASRFVPHPFAGPRQAGARLYRTGDLAWSDSDGRLTFLGRVDRQLALRGFRIEPGEIEVALETHRAVSECAVGSIEQTGGAGRLAAWVVAESGASVLPDELRAHLLERLPPYMVPSRWIPLAALPRTATGKLDRRSLPTQGAARAGYVEPSGERERTLARIWSEVLDVERVGTHDSFFELGGDSILSIQIVARAAEAGIAITPQQIFDHPTVAALAEAAGRIGEASPEAAGDENGPLPLTPIQRWFFDLDLVAPEHWNMAIAVDLAQPVDAGLLTRALAYAVRRHRSLSTRFTRTGEGWSAEIPEPEEAGTVLSSTVLSSTVPSTVLSTALIRVDLAQIEAGAPRDPALSDLAPLQGSLSLERGELLRAVLFERRPPSPARLVLVVHHLVMDAVGWGILLGELELVYRQLEAGQEPLLPPVPTPWRRWAESLAQQAAGPTVARRRALWQQGAPAAEPLPGDRPEAPDLEKDADNVTERLDAERTRALLGVAREAYRMRADEIVLTALAEAYRSWAGSSRLTLHLEGHGREDLDGQADLSRTVGWFTTLYPARLELADGTPPREALKSVKEQLRKLPDHGLSWGLLRWPPEGDPGLEPEAPPEIAFNYLGRAGAQLRGGELFRLSGELPAAVRSPEGRRPHALEINAFVDGASLVLDLRYGALRFERETIERLARSTLAALERLIDHCLAPHAGGFTPSDFPAAGLEQAGLDRFLERLAEPVKGSR